jgi:IMP cyclohydrolase
MPSRAREQAVSKGYRMLPEELILVCALADSELTVAGSSFDRMCSRCNSRVMVSPSGQQRVRDNPHIEIVCIRCLSTIKPPADSKVMMSPETTEDLIAELKKTVRNPWRERN